MTMTQDNINEAKIDASKVKEDSNRHLTKFPDSEKDPEEAPRYIAVKPDRPIYGEFYRHLRNNGYKIFTDGAANILFIHEDEIDFALTCLKDRNIGYKFV